MKKLLCLFVIIITGSYAAESTKEELQKFGNEIPKIISQSKAKTNVAVTLLSPRVMGVTCETPQARIVIIDHGYEENVKTLKHELNHLKRFEEKDPNWRDEPPAVEAEKR